MVGKMSYSMSLQVAKVALTIYFRWVQMGNKAAKVKMLTSMQNYKYSHKHTE